MARIFHLKSLLADHKQYRQRHPPPSTPPPLPPSSASPPLFPNERGHKERPYIDQPCFCLYFNPRCCPSSCHCDFSCERHARCPPIPRESRPPSSMASIRWSSQWWLQLEGDWADDRGNKYSLTLDLDTCLSYTVLTLRPNRQRIRTTYSLIYNLRGEVLWGEDGQ